MLLMQLELGEVLAACLAYSVEWRTLECTSTCYDVTRVYGSANRICKKNFRRYNRESVVMSHEIQNQHLKGVRLIGGTLLSDCRNLFLPPRPHLTAGNYAKVGKIEKSFFKTRHKTLKRLTALETISKRSTAADSQPTTP